MARNIAIHTHGEFAPASKFPRFQTDQTLVWYYNPDEQGVSNALCLQQSQVKRICGLSMMSLSSRPLSRPVMEGAGEFDELVLSSLDGNPDIYDCVTDKWYEFPREIRHPERKYVRLSNAIRHIRDTFAGDLRIHILACGKRRDVSEKRETHLLEKGGKRRKTRRRKTRRSQVQRR